MHREAFEMRVRQAPFHTIGRVVYEYLQQEIVTLRLEPGHALSETQVATDLGVSRSPVQAAIRQLTEERLLEKTPGKMPRVSQVRYEDCVDICRMRHAIEGEAAFDAAKHITPQQLSALSDSLTACKKAFEQSAIADERIDTRVPQLPVCDDDFHRRIVAASENEYFIKAYRLYESRLTRYRRYIWLKSPYRADDAQAYFNIHFAILAALKNRFSTQARDEMRYDIHHMRDALRFLSE